jgi:hypothetical protein
MPRPILKPASSPGPANLPPANPVRVSFPPSPAMVTATHVVLSRQEYDRSPLVVMPNDLALPERGCPGRTYTLSSHSSSSMASALSKSAGKTIHPAKAAVQAAARSSFHNLMPPLMPDTSSSSETESDGLISPPPEPVGPLSSHSLAFVPSKPIPIDPSIPYARVQSHGSSPLNLPPHLHDDSDKALAFLPHSPTRSSPRRKSPTRKAPATFSSSWEDQPTEGVLGGF